MKLLVTGGAGFIGSNFVRYVLDAYPDYEVVVLDKLTYAGNLDNILQVQHSPRFRFQQGDINDAELVDRMVADVDAVANFAAETHVDRSILDPGAFIQTDVHGVWVLLEAARRHRLSRFLQVSTDEVYGDVPVGSSREEDRLAPRSPYSASKAGGELLAQAYWTTYGLPVVISRGSNTIGPFQYPEKAVPLFVTNAIDDQPLPIYGDGKQRRDWLYVDDHCSALDLKTQAGDLREQGVTLREMGRLELARGDPGSAAGFFQRGLQAARDAGDSEGETHLQRALAETNRILKNKPSVRKGSRKKG